MTDVTVRRLERADAAILDQVERQFVMMYEYMNAHGLLMRLAPEGEKRWRRSVERALGRFSTLAVAMSGDTVAGFAHGAIAMVPDYLGGGVVAQVNHVFVDEGFRGLKLTTRMIDVLTEWFVEKHAASIELQVLHGNEHAIEVWEHLGFRRELHQLRWFLREQPA